MSCFFFGAVALTGSIVIVMLAGSAADTTQRAKIKEQRVTINFLDIQTNTEIKTHIIITHNKQ